MTTKRRFPWARGEKQDPSRAELRRALNQVKKLAAAADQYFDDGCYAPLGGLMIYLRKDINAAMKEIRKLTKTYSR